MPTPDSPFDEASVLADIREAESAKPDEIAKPAVGGRGVVSSRVAAMKEQENLEADILSAELDEFERGEAQESIRTERAAQQAAIPETPEEAQVKKYQGVLSEQRKGVVSGIAGAFRVGLTGRPVAESKPATTAPQAVAETVDRSAAWLVRGAYAGASALQDVAQQVVTKNVPIISRSYAAGAQEMREAGAAMGAQAASLIPFRDWHEDPVIKEKVREWASGEGSGFQNWWWPFPNRVTYAGLQTIKALGDFTLANRVFETWSKEYDKYAEEDRPVETRSVALNALAATPNTFGADASMMLFAGERVTGALLKGSNTLLSAAEQRLAPNVRAYASSKAYSAAIELEKKVTAAREFKNFEGVKEQLPLFDAAAAEGSQALLSLDNTLNTPKTPPRFYRVLAALQAAAEKGSSLVKTARGMLDKDILENVKNPITAMGLNVTRMADQVAAMEAYKVVENLRKEIFGPGQEYITSADVKGEFGLVRSVLGTSNRVGEWLNRSKIKTFAEAKGISYEAARSHLDTVLRSVDRRNPYMVKVADEATRFMETAPEAFPEFINDVNELSHQKLLALDAKLVDESGLGFTKGAVEADVVRASKITPEQIGQARLEAFETAWGQYKERIRAQVESRYPGDTPQFIDHLMKTVEEYNRILRRDVEPVKLREGGSLLQDLYYHHLSSTKSIKTMPARESAILANVKASAMFERSGQGAIDWAKREHNLFDILETDLKEVHFAKERNRGTKMIVEEAKAWRPLREERYTTKQGKTATRRAEYVDPRTGKVMELTDGGARDTGFVRPRFDDIDAHIIRASPIVQQLRQEAGALSDGLNLALDPGGYSMLKQLEKNLDDAAVITDTLAPAHVKELNAAVARKNIVVSAELQEYMHNMTNSKNAINRALLDPTTLHGKGFKFIRDTSGIIKQILCSFDLGGGAQRLVQYSGIQLHYGPGVLRDVLKATQRNLDARMLPTFEAAVREGSVYLGRRGLAERSVTMGGQLTPLQKMGPVSRLMAYNDRAMYGRDFANMGFDLRTRLALRKVLDERFKGRLDALSSDPITKKMYFSNLQFWDNIFGEDSQQIFRNRGRLDSQKMAFAVNKVMGDYNLAARTPFQQFLGEHFYGFYGWWRGTFTPIMAAPLNHPIHAVAAPLVAMDAMNYTFSGDHMYNNPVGHRTKIRVDPKRFGINAEPFYIEPPANIRRGFNLLALENVDRAVRMADEGHGRQAAQYLAHDLIAYPGKVVKYSSFVPFGKGTPGYQTSAAYNLATNIMDYVNHASNRTWTSADDEAIRTIFKTFNFQGEDLYNDYVKGGFWRGFARAAVSTLSPIQITEEDPDAGKKALKAERDRLYGGRITRDESVKQIREKREQGGAQSVTGQQRAEIVSMKLEERYPGDKRKQGRAQNYLLKRK